MLDLIADHQGPRIKFYFKSLKQAFQSSVQPRVTQSRPGTALAEKQVEGVPVLTTREWEDNNGFLFTISLCQPVRLNPQDEIGDANSDTAHAGETLSGIQTRILELFSDLRQRCEHDSTSKDEMTSPKDIMVRIFDLWRENHGLGSCSEQP
jgi:hypothetical protein